jgi:alkylation response protein AidB-like acyl-CoA dehydrogenase
VSQNGIFLLAPTMLEYGTEAQKARYLPPMASGEEIWCQGWSEPDAGSDLAGIRSRAARNAGCDGWVLNGQKTWASRGAFAEWCFGIFRTDPEAERHRGLTYFLVAMDSPGVTVRPIPQIDGETGFAEIFFDNVEVPEDQVLGEVGAGWSVAMATAGSERGLSLRSPARYTEAADRLLQLFHQRGGPAASADAVAQAHMDAEAYQLHTYWTASRVARGHAVGAEASCNKIFWSETDVAIHGAALDLLGPDAELLEAGAPGEWLDGYLFSLAGPIYAGTNEIQRNVVAERLLGLPRG